MAEVYRAYHVSLDRFVAIKVLHAFLADDPEFQNRFEKEARNIARLKHPHIVQVYDFENDSDNESYYMVMELIEGPTLKDLLYQLGERGELMSLSETLRIARESASALAYAHSQNMIHRDVKPANLMLDRDNRVVLTDFGIAKIVTGAQFTASGGMVGTPAYMAPEQGLGDAGDERSDLYSLGVILFQLVTGRLPYDADTPLAIILKHLNDPIPPLRDFNPDAPNALQEIVLKAMAKAPEERYQTAAEMIADLERFERGEPVAPALSPDAADEEEYGTLNLATETAEARRITQERQAQAAEPQPATAAASGRQPPRRRFPWWLLILLLIVIIGGGGLFALQASGVPLLAFLATETPTPSATPTATATDTIAPTRTDTLEPTSTHTPSPSDTPTETATQTFTPTDTDTLVPTETPTNTRQPSSTPTASLTPTATATRTVVPSPTRRPSNTPTPTRTFTPSITPTPSITLTPTPNITQTLQQATLFFDFQTATYAACDFNYEILSQDPPDADFYPANRSYTRTITLRNTGECAWERNTGLYFVSGENFDAEPRILIRDRVGVSEEVTITFQGRTPQTLDMLTGVWELRTPGQILIGEQIFISINVFEGG